jgi:CBS domain-containing protein
MTSSGLGTFVSYNPMAAAPETTVDRLLEMVKQLHMHHFPVVEGGGRLLGMISEMEVLSALVHRGAAVGDQPLRAEFLLNRDFVAIGPQAKPRQALELLVAHGLHSLPVIADGRLLGIVTTADFLREFSYGELPGSREPAAGHLPPLPETVEPDVTLEEALLTMQETAHLHLAVVQGGCPIGLVSEIDIIRARCHDPAGGSGDAEGNDRPVSSVMRRAPTFRPGQRLCEAAALMIEHELPALIVTNQANRFLGVLSQNVLLSLMLRQLK